MQTLKGGGTRINDLGCRESGPIRRSNENETDQLQIILPWVEMGTENCVLGVRNSIPHSFIQRFTRLYHETYFTQPPLHEKKMHTNNY